MARERRPRAPIGLGPGGRKLWGNMHDTFSFEGEPQKLAVLERACRTIDRIDQLDAAMMDQPLLVKGSRTQNTPDPKAEDVCAEPLGPVVICVRLPSTNSEPAFGDTARVAHAR